MIENNPVDFASAHKARERLRELVAFNSENGFVFVEDSWRDEGEFTVYVADTRNKAIYVFPWAPESPALQTPENVTPWELLNLSFEVIADPDVFVDKTHLLQTEAIAASALKGEYSLWRSETEQRGHVVVVMDLSSKAGLLDMKVLAAENVVLPRHRVEAVVEKLCGGKGD